MVYQTHRKSFLKKIHGIHLSSGTSARAACAGTVAVTSLPIWRPLATSASAFTLRQLLYHMLFCISFRNVQLQCWKMHWLKNVSNFLCSKAMNSNSKSNFLPTRRTRTSVVPKNLVFLKYSFKLSHRWKPRPSTFGHGPKRSLSVDNEELIK